MCRIAAGVGDMTAFRAYLRDTSNSMRELARANPHGWGIGAFVDGRATLDKAPTSALDDPTFANAPWLADARSAIAHVRFATSGEHSRANSHPFAVGDRMLAHNGTIREQERIDDVLGSHAGLVRGETDSERFAALLTRNIELADGDVEQGYRATTAWLADHHPMTSLSSVMTDATGDVWALRYPENRTLFWKPMGAHDAAAGVGQLPAGAPATGPDLTVIASVPLDASAGWRALGPGELLHVTADGRADVRTVIGDEPLRRLGDRQCDAPAEAWTGPRRATVVDATLAA